jgi:hypothetical protein
MDGGFTPRRQTPPNAVRAVDVGGTVARYTMWRPSRRNVAAPKPTGCKPAEQPLQFTNPPVIPTTVCVETATLQSILWKPLRPVRHLPTSLYPTFHTARVLTTSTEPLEALQQHLGPKAESALSHHALHSSSSLLLHKDLGIWLSGKSKTQTPVRAKQSFVGPWWARILPLHTKTANALHRYLKEGILLFIHQGPVSCPDRRPPPLSAAQPAGVGDLRTATWAPCLVSSPPSYAPGPDHTRNCNQVEAAGHRLNGCPQPFLQWGHGSRWPPPRDHRLPTGHQRHAS